MWAICVGFPRKSCILSTAIAAAVTRWRKLAFAICLRVDSLERCRAIFSNSVSMAFLRRVHPGILLTVRRFLLSCLATAFADMPEAKRVRIFDFSSTR